MTVPLVELRDIVVEYRHRGATVRAVDGASFSVWPASTVAIIGRSGSGKTSFVSVLGLMRSPSSGVVLLDGEAVTAAPRARSRFRAGNVATVYQSFHLAPRLTALENCMFPWYWQSDGSSRRQASRRAIELLELVGLAPLAGRRAVDLSGGERQRVAVARALFPRPKLLVADEPTGNLDEDTAASVSTLLYSLPDVLGTAVVVVTHDRTVASGAERVLVMTRGMFERDSSPSEVPAS
jgi:ABC-type lipoprotein export system ATPase subunit